MAQYRATLIAQAKDIKNTEKIFEYGSAMFYGDYGFQQDRDKAKEQFLRIRNFEASSFMLKTKYNAPIKPLYRKRMTKKEEDFITTFSDPIEDYEDRSLSCCCCCLIKDLSENEGGDQCISNAVDFSMLMKSLWPIIAIVLSIVKIFQGASISSQNKSISFNKNISKIVDWSIKLVRDIINWTQVENISATQTGMMMSFLVLVGFGFPLCSLNISAPMFIICLLSSLIFLPIGIGIAKQNWIIFGLLYNFMAFCLVDIMED